MEDSSPPMKSWSIHTRRDIISKYEILERVGSGAYSDVYKARRRSDLVTVALKEVHDHQSAFREIEALQTLQNCPNTIVLHEYFWSEEEDAVLVLEFFTTDLAAVIKAAKKMEGGVSTGQVKRWMVQILQGIDGCHRNSVVHRDLKPSNLLISAEGVLKIADFGQARILLAPGLAADGYHIQPHKSLSLQGTSTHTTEVGCGRLLQELNLPHIEECTVETDEIKGKGLHSDFDKDSTTHDGAASCLATYATSDLEDPYQDSCSYEADDDNNILNGPLTSCVGTRWFRAPELLYGSTNYGLEIDLWSVGCIFAELLNLEPIFPGASDIDQLSKIFSILGNVTQEVWPGCEELPDYKIISFEKVEKPVGLEGFLCSQSPDEVNLVKKLLCFDPVNRATAMELLHDKYLEEDPLPVPLSELWIPSKHENMDEDSSVEWNYDKNLGSDSDFDDFGISTFTATENGFSIRFS